MRWIRTNKNKDDPLGDDGQEAKSRVVVPGDVDPDGDKPREDGGFRTDAPTCPQIALHLLFSKAVRARWKLKTFDVSSAFLSGEKQTRDIYVRPPIDGNYNLEKGSLLKLEKGVYGLKEAPRLWYLKARSLIQQAGWKELSCAKAVFVMRNKQSRLTGMMVLHVDDACYGGEGPEFQASVKKLKTLLNIGKEAEGDFDFLGEVESSRFKEVHIWR